MDLAAVIAMCFDGVDENSYVPSMIRQTIILVIVALVVGIGIGFGFRSPIAGVLNLNALELPSDCTGTDSASSFLGIVGKAFAQRAPCADKYLCIAQGGSWVITNGKGICVYTSQWNQLQWKRFLDCLQQALQNPPPPPPSHGVTQNEYNACLLTGQG